jgi:histidine triad (HIT) family protein
MENCIFCKIIKGEIPSKKIYEDDDVFAFHDVHPAAPVHFMLIPKLHIASLDDVEEKHRDLLGKIILLAPRLAKEQGCTDEIYHLHTHIIGGGTERLPVMIPNPS